MKNKELQKLKSSIPNKIKKLSIGFDVSTTNTGYAIIADGELIQQVNGMPSFGTVKMVKEEKNKVGNMKTKLYEAYGDRMTHGSEGALNRIFKILFDIFTPITEHYYTMKRLGKDFTINNIYLVLEVSEIPNGKPGKFGQSLTATRKLGLYTGAVLATIWNCIGLAFEPFRNKVQVKLIKPGEWQARLWDKQEAYNLNVYSETGKSIKERGSKIMSIKKANEFLRSIKHQELTSYSQNDAADAINIARVAEEVRDNIFARKIASKKAKDIKINYNRDIYKLANQLTQYKEAALNNKHLILNMILTYQDKKYDVLTSTEKRLYTKYSKLDYKEASAKDAIEYLTPAKKKKYFEWEDKKLRLEKELKDLRTEKVIK